MLKSKDKTMRRMAQKAGDAFRLLAVSMQEVAIQRKFLIKPDLNGVFKLICSPDNKVTNHLFGDDLAKQIKDIDEAQKVGRKVNKSDNYRPKYGQQYNHSFPKRAREEKGKFSYGRGQQPKNHQYRPF